MLNIKKSHKTYHNHAAFQYPHAPEAPTPTSVKARITYCMYWLIKNQMMQQQSDEAHCSILHDANSQLPQSVEEL